ncbi:MAG: GNAT family N-acetyltransferase [Hamadaea sp.]|nr:GNAT family N-acetyltransferase [Hamadaea sp.]
MTFAYPEVIEANGVRLRHPRVEDAPEVRRAFDDEATIRFLASVREPTLEFAEEWCTTGAAAVRAEGGIRYLAVDSKTDAVVAAASLRRVQADRAQAEIGYWVAPWARGNGLAKSVVRALSTAAFEAGLVRIELCVEWENVASQRVALASGYRREGVRRSAAARLDSERYDLIAYVRLATDPGDPIRPGLPPLPGGRLSDGVVTVRPERLDDVADLVALLALPEVAETNFGDASPEALARKCARSEALWLAGDRAAMIIEDAETGAFAGDIGFHYFMPFLQEGMIGYSLRPEFRGRGFTTRAVRLVAQWAFEHAGVARLIAGTDPKNVASQKVLQRAGFEREAYMRDRMPAEDGGRQDDIQWVLLPENRRRPVD